MYNVTIFGIDITLDPVAFTLGGWKIYWYGIIIAIGFSLAIIYGFRNAERLGINKDKMLDVVLVVTPIAILCARAYYVIFDDRSYDSISDFFGFGDSSGFAGLAIYGGVIGAFVSGFIMCKVRKVKFTDMFDLAALGFLIGQGIGRWGNFINQEAFGTFTGSSWWGMQSEKTVDYMQHFVTENSIEGLSSAQMMGEGLVHPCFLYESLWCILGFVLIHYLSKKRRFSGEVFLMYTAWYGFGRGFIEFLRTDSLMWGEIKISCFLGFAACITSLILITVLRNKYKPEGEYISVFGENEEEKEIEAD